MTMLEGRVGEVKGADGASGIVRLEKSLAQVVAQAGHGKYYEAAVNGRMFWAANTAAQAISVALTTTYTGLCVSNPANSGVNLVPVSVMQASSVDIAALCTIHLIGGFSAAGVVTHSTALIAQSTLLDNEGRLGKAKADSAATIVNPKYLLALRAASDIVAGTAEFKNGQTLSDLDGMFVVPPGGWVAVGALTATTVLCSFVWEEIPII